MRTRTGTIAALAAVLTLALAGAAQAANLNATTGTYTVDTTALTLTGTGVNATGSDVGGIAVFSFDEVNVSPGVTINVAGSRPFELVASGNMTMAGIINGSGTSATDFHAGPNAGGPGGGAGGANGTVPGGGPGGGGTAGDTKNGGGGGGFGGAGARGAVDSGSSSPAGAAGAAYGNLNTLLQGGSGGAGGTATGSITGGGGGGGGIGLFAASLSIPPTGDVLAIGGNGACGGFGASGAGSGGGILLHAETMEVSGLLDAAGGLGGVGGGYGDGGGGGGGRIAYQYRTLLASGNAVVPGGASGARSTGGTCTAHGGVSPDPVGATGVITKSQAASATTSPATGVSSEGATLNGSVNPHGTATSYRFEYGTTPSYGASVPVGAASVGSDSSDHVLSQSLTGLAPGTTYHYRVVATDALGFTTRGADVGFTTTAASPPPPPAKPKAPKTKLTKATIDKEGGSATFKFKATGASTGFQCSLAKKGKKAKFKKCRSPKHYKGLKAGKYTFQVKAVNGSAADKTPAKKKFTIG